MSQSSEPSKAVCPLAAVDRRLDDVHRQWHQAEAAYFDPDAFRVAIQTVIQTLRTVTFILQSNKAKIPDFTAWYQEWQDRLRADPLMRWMVDARNRIEKQGDLEAHSYIRAEIIASYLNEGPAEEISAELGDAPLTLLRKIPTNDLGKHIKKDGLLRVQRRWVENTLPDHELLDAVAIAYGRISELVADGHVAMGLPEPIVHDDDGKPLPSGFRNGRMPCMINHGEARTTDFDLATGAVFTVATKTIPVDKSMGPALEERYGIRVEDVCDTTSGSDSILQSLFKTARAMFLKDRHHVTLAFMTIGAQPVDMAQLQPEKHGEKYLLMRKVAELVTHNGADTLIVIGESWRAVYDSAKPYRRAVDAPDRTEFLVATMVSKDGEPVQLAAEILREGEDVKLGDTQTERGGSHFLFAPIYDVWGKRVPDDWTGHMDQAPA